MQVIGKVCSVLYISCIRHVEPLTVRFSVPSLSLPSIFFSSCLYVIISLFHCYFLSLSFIHCLPFNYIFGMWKCTCFLQLSIFCASLCMSYADVRLCVRVCVCEDKTSIIFLPSAPPPGKMDVLRPTSAANKLSGQGFHCRNICPQPSTDHTLVAEICRAHLRPDRPGYHHRTPGGHGDGRQLQL